MSAVAGSSEPAVVPGRRVRSDVPFLACMAALALSYIALIVAMLAADVAFSSPADLWRVLQSREIRYSIALSLVTCTLSAILSLWVAVPAGYLLSRCEFRGKALLDALFDIPIVLPPLVVGLSLLILFRGADWMVYRIPSIVLAQFAVACAFAVRTMRVTFDQIDPRRERVALTLGCSRAQAFFRVVLPEAWRGVLTAGTLAWARALGEFGPILVFSGATRMRTEVLPTTVFLELSLGDLEAALAVSILMVIAAILVLGVTRMFGMRGAIL